MALQLILDQNSGKPIEAVLKQITEYLIGDMMDPRDTRAPVAQFLLEEIAVEFQRMFEEGGKFFGISYSEFEQFMSEEVLPLTRKVSTQYRNDTLCDPMLSESELDKTNEGISHIARIVIAMNDLDCNPKLFEAALYFSTKLVQGINIIQEVERLMRVAGRDRNKKAYEMLAKLPEVTTTEDNTTRLFFTRSEVKTLTAHPNKAVTDEVQLVTNQIISMMVEKIQNERSLGHSSPRSGEEIRQLFRGEEKEVLAEHVHSLVFAPLLSPHKPTPLDEAESLIRLMTESYFPGALQFLRDGRETRRVLLRAFAEVVDPLPEMRTWVGTDLDGRPDHTPEEMREVLCLYRRKGVDRYIKHLEGLRAFTINESPEWQEQFDRLFDRLEQARIFFSHETPYSSFEFFNDLTALGDCASGEYLRRRILEVGEKAKKQGLSLLRNEMRENTEVGDLATEAILRAALTPEEYSQLPRSPRKDGVFITHLDAKQPILLELLGDPAAIKHLAASIENGDSVGGDREAFLRLRHFLTEARLFIERDPGLIQSFIISLFQHPTHYLQAMLFTRVAGLNGKDEVKLPLTPLSETPEDLAAAAQTAEKLFSIKEVQDFIRADGDRIVWLWGFSDSGMRGGFCSRESIRQAQKAVGGVGEKFRITVFDEEGRGPRSGRGGGLFTRFMWATQQSLRHLRNHVTIQGEGVQQLFGHPEIVQRSLAVAAESFCRGISKISESPSQRWAEWEKLRGEAFGDGLLAYEHFIDRVEGGNPDRVLEALELIVPVQSLELNTASRPLFRSLPVRFESLRAVPNNIISDISRLCWVTLYGTGVALEKLTNQQNRQFTASMISNDPEFERDIESLLLSLQRSNVPRVIAATRAIYADQKGSEERVDKLFELLNLIEADYKKLADAVAVLEEDGALNTILKRRTFRAIREARTLKDPATNFFLFASMIMHKHGSTQYSERVREIAAHNMQSVDSAG